MWESRSDFQGRWKGWETGVGFSTLSTARHFHRSQPPVFGVRGGGFLRSDSPLSSMRCAVWMMRSRIPSAIVGSPICSYHCATGNCEVSTSERV